MSKHPLAPPPRLGEGPGACGRRPLPAVALSAVPQERLQFPAYSHLSGRRGAAEKQRGGAPGGRSGRPCHAEAERLRSSGSWRGQPRFLSRGSESLSRRLHALRAGFSPVDLQPAGLGLNCPAWGSDSKLWSVTGEAGGGGFARAPCWPCPEPRVPRARPHPPAASSAPVPTAGTCVGLWAQSQGIPAGKPRRTAVRPFQARPPALTGNLNSNSLMSRAHPPGQQSEGLL